MINNIIININKKNLNKQVVKCITALNLSSVLLEPFLRYVKQLGQYPFLK